MGTKNSNKNSAAQSARKKGKLVKGSAVRLTGADINTIETMTDAHKIASAEYDYSSPGSTVFAAWRRRWRQGFNAKHEAEVKKSLRALRIVQAYCNRHFDISRKNRAKSRF